MSMNSCPRFAPSLIPLGPSATNSTSGEFGSIVMITSTADATSFGDVAAVAPSLTQFIDFARLRLWTTSGKPALSRFLAIGFPMMPRPMNPILGCAIAYLLLPLLFNFASTEKSSSVVVSPTVALPAASSRNRRRMILPLRVLGSASVKRMSSGLARAPISFAT